MTAPRCTPPPAAALVVTDEAAAVLAAAVLAGAPVDPRVAALCRWALAADVAGLRRDLTSARVEAALTREDFYRMRALHHDRAPRSTETAVESDTLDEDLSDAIPVLLENDDTNEETPVRQATTLRIQRSVHRQTRRSVSATDG